MTDKIKKHLKELDVNKTVVFYSPLEGDDVLARTGSISDSSSLFHAILYAYSREYVAMSKNERLAYVSKLRASLLGNVTIESWRELSDGLLAKKPFIDSILDIIKNLYDYICNNKSSAKGKHTRRIISKLLVGPETIELYTLVSELLPIEVLKKDLLSRAYKVNTSKNIKTTCVNIVTIIAEYLDTLPELSAVDSTKMKYICNSVSNLFEHVFEEAEKMAYENYIKGMSTMEINLTSDILETISKRIDRNIYFIDSNTRMPCNTKITSGIIAERKSIILLQMNSHKYETIGRLLPDNRVQREFSADDPIIECINLYILSPKKFIKKYPDIAPFMNHKAKREDKREESSTEDESEESEDSHSRSRSNSEESDKYYDSSSDSKDSKDSSDESS